MRILKASGCLIVLVAWSVLPAFAKDGKDGDKPPAARSPAKPPCPRW
jgi:hypothetical protein